MRTSWGYLPPTSQFRLLSLAREGEVISMDVTGTAGAPPLYFGKRPKGFQEIHPPIEKSVLLSVLRRGWMERITNPTYNKPCWRRDYRITPAGEKWLEENKHLKWYVYDDREMRGL